MYKNLEWCCKKQIKPLYNDIKYKEYFEPIKRFSKEYNITDIKHDILNDLVIQYYIKSRTDISIIVLYPTTVKYENVVDNVINKLQKHGDIHYIKDIDLDYFSGYNLIFQLYASEKRMKKNSEIIYKINRLGFKDDKLENRIKIIVYTLTDKNKKINGNSAEFKMELRDYFVNEAIKTTEYQTIDDKYPRGYDYIHISDDVNQSYEYASIFFHKNSLKFIKKQKSWRILEMIKTKILFNKLKDFFYSYSQKEIESLIIFSSGVLYSYGIREANDLDCILLENNIIKPELIEELNKKNMLDISFKGTKEYNDIWHNELNNRAKIFGAKNYNELIANPKFYYYFMGLKIIRLKYDLKLRFSRGRPAQFTDLLVVRQMYNFSYKLQVPTKTKEFDEKNGCDIYKDVSKKIYLQKIKFYLKTRYFIDITIDQIEKWIDTDYIVSVSDSPENYSELSGGTSSFNKSIYFEKLTNEATNKYIYPSQGELLKLGYSPNIVIYSTDKPYLYPGEDFDMLSTIKLCQRVSGVFKPKKNALRIATFNLHNFISRCNQGIAPIFGTALNPFEKIKDIDKFIKLFQSVDADILCFQELVPITNKEIKKDIHDIEFIRNNFNFEYFNKIMESIGYKYKIVSSVQNGKFYDFEKRDYYYLANAIYSKIKLEEEEIYGFKYYNRNIITANINFKNKKIQIFNTHLEYFDSKNSILTNLGSTENPIVQQYNDLYQLTNLYNNPNTIICGDFNINIFKKGEGFRYKNWENKTNMFRDNYINSNRSSIPTNFSQNDQTDLICCNKASKLKIIYSFTVFTNISDHYLYFSDFI